MPAPLEPLRVVIADDHPVYRQGLAKLLTKSGIDVVAEAASGLLIAHEGGRALLNNSLLGEAA